MQVSGEDKLDGAYIVKADMMATNGVAQGIDTVMLPTFAPQKKSNSTALCS